MKKILIIGSKGFIGNRLAYIFKNEFDVYGCDILGEESLRYFVINPVSPDFFSILNKHDFHSIVNCSGAASVKQSIDNPVNDFNLNSYNVFLILDAIRRSNAITKFINLSSAAIYGNPIQNPISETSEVKPMSPYGFNKRISEVICEEFKYVWNIHSISLRVFSAYGEGLKKQILWDVYKKTRENNEFIELFGTGLESRDFIHIIDLINVIRLVIQDDHNKYDCINVGNGSEVMIRDLVRTFLKFIEYDGECRFIGKNRDGDPINWCADITLLNKLGYKQVVSLEDGLKKYSDWIKKL